MLHDYRDNTLSDFYGDVRPGFDDRREIDVDRGHFVIRFWIAGANAGANRRRRFANLLMCRQLRFIAFTFAMQRSRSSNLLPLHSLFSQNRNAGSGRMRRSV